MIKDTQKAESLKEQVVDSRLEGVTVFGDKILVKMLRYEAPSTTESGLLNPRYKIGESDGGKMIASIDDHPYQTRGVVVAKGDSDLLSKINIGQIVWINIRHSTNPAYDIVLDRDLQVAEPTEYKLFNSSVIELATPEIYEIVYADKSDN